MALHLVDFIKQETIHALASSWAQSNLCLMGLTFSYKNLNMVAINFSPLQNLKWLIIKKKHIIEHLTKVVFGVLSSGYNGFQNNTCPATEETLDIKGHIIQKPTAIITSLVRLCKWNCAYICLLV